LSRKASYRVVALAVCGALVVAGCGSASRPVNLILITVDTLRADHLGIDGYGRDTSPNLDALARDGKWFPRCYTQSVTTRASHAALLTSSFPRTNGVLSNAEEYPDRPSILSVLRGRGFTTAGFVSSVVLDRTFGVQRQLDHFDDVLTTSERNRPFMGERPARETFHAALRYLAGRDRSKPFFVWIHLIDPHGPYAAPEQPDRFVGDALARAQSGTLPLGAGNRGFEEIPLYQALDGVRDPGYYVARYDAEIRYTDAALGDFVSRLKTLDLFEGTLLAVTADHGETLAEPSHHRYFSHGLVAYEEDSRVPLVIYAARGRRRLAAIDASRPVLSIDVAPTLLDLLGVEAPPEFTGRSILRAPRPADTAILSLGSYGSAHLEREVGTQWTVRRGPWRYVFNTIDGAEELYDHRHDAQERSNVAAAHPAELAGLRRLLNAYRAAPGTRNRDSDVSPDERERLRALGYAH
jgi:arylsulfatase